MDTTDHERQIAEQVAAEFERSGLAVPEYPASTSDALRLLEIAGYDVPGDDLLSWMNSGSLPVEMINGRRQWGPHQLVGALMQAEARRRWKYGDGRHWHKFSNAERIVIESRMAGAKTPIADCEHLDIEALLHIMEGSDQQHVRHVLRLAIQQKLRESAE